MIGRDPAALRLRLEQALGFGLKAEVAAIGARLLARLGSPVQMILIGRPGVGKSALRGMLQQQSAMSACVVSELTIDHHPQPLAGAARQADIVLWCGQGFDATDLDLWAEVPDQIKDHSFFVLTKADQLAAQGHLQSTLAALADITADAFLGVFPIATLQALSACSPQLTLAEPAFRASGAAALTAAICKQIAQAHGAICDSAWVFLERYGGADIAGPPAQIVQHRSVPAEQHIWARPFACLEQRARDLASAQQMPADEKIRHIIAHCCQTTDRLIDLMADCANPNPAQACLREEILGVADTLVLMQLESSAQSAVDAMALILQLRRDLAMGAAI